MSVDPVDEAVLKAFFEAVRPSQRNALEALLAKETAERAQFDGHWRARVKRAQRDSEEAERQYHQVNPRNRLVADTVERRWEEKLFEQRSLEEAYDRFLHAPSPSGSLRPEVKRNLLNLSETLPMLWEAGKIGRQDMKELLRCLISRVILHRPSRDTVSARIIWSSNGYLEVTGAACTQKMSQLSNYQALCRRGRQLWEAGEDDDGIAGQLMVEGFRSPRATTPSFFPNTVQRIRRRHGWIHLPIPEGYLTVHQLAGRLGVGHNPIYYWLKKGKIESKHLAPHESNGRWLIRDTPALFKLLRRKVETGRCLKEH